MKTRRVATAAMFACVMLMTTHEAQAFYNPSAGRWLNRDPIEEQGGVNLELFVINNPESVIDALGQEATNDPPKKDPPMPPDPSIPGGSSGITFCGLDLPVDNPMVTKVRDNLGPNKSCVQAHEDAHAHSQEGCCKKARAAFQAAGADRYKVQKEWNQWVTKNNDYEECKAHQAGAECSKQLQKNNGCQKCYDDWKKGKNLTKEQEALWPTCLKIRDHERDENAYADIYCKRKGAKSQSACPFK